MRYWIDNTEMTISRLTLTFDHVTWNQMGKYPLNRGIHCSMFGDFKAKGWKDIDRTTFVYRPAVLTLTFDHVTWKSIGCIYFLGASTLSSLATFKQGGQSTLSGQRWVYRPTKPTNRQVQNRVFSKGHKKHKTWCLNSMCLRKKTGVLF